MILGNPKSILFIPSLHPELASLHKTGDISLMLIPRFPFALEIDREEAVRTVEALTKSIQ